MNWVIHRFRLVAFSPFCMRPLRGYLCIVQDSWGLGVADSTLLFEMEVTNGDPPDVPCSESATGLPLRFDSLTIVSVPAGLPPTSFSDPIADCAELSSNAKLDSPSSIGCLSVVITSAISQAGVSLQEPAENLITALNLEDPLAFSTVVETFLRSCVEARRLRVAIS